MAVTVTWVDKSIIPISDYAYQITNLVNGSNSISLPTPPAKGSFPVAGDWTPTNILCFPYNASAVGALVTPDLNTIANSSGAITFTLYATGATSCLVIVC